LVNDTAGEAYTPRLGQGLQSGGDVDAVAVDVVAVDDDITEVDADAESDPPVYRVLAVAPGHPALDGNGAFQRVDDAGELDQGAVADQLDDAAVVFANRRVDEFGAEGLECRQRPRLVRAHHPAVTHYVGAAMIAVSLDYSDSLLSPFLS
jgi:hypothetical protein